MANIESVRALEILDSRGNPTVMVEVVSGRVVGQGIAPSGASTGAHEALELRDGDPARFAGRGVRQAIANVLELIAPRIVGRSLDDLFAIDQIMLELDATGRCAKLGANAMLAVSLAAAHAAAGAQGAALYESMRTPAASLPLPMVNMISGGLHAGRQIEVQDFLILPVGASSFRQAMEWIVAVYRALGAELLRRGHESILVGDEGGYGPKLENNTLALEYLVHAILAAGLEPGAQVALGVDAASSHFYRGGRYYLRLGGDEEVDLDADAMIEMLSAWVDAYPIVSIEDGLAEDDWDGWKKLQSSLGRRVQLIGDDLLVTHPERLARGVREQSANAILIKPNQIGTLSQTLAVLRQAQAAGWNTIVSARSGETEDATIADLAVASGAGQIKIGSVARSERLAKYNRLLWIEERSGLPFAGGGPLAAFRRAQITVEANAT